jgi:phosphatidylserine/phosphatidylglycerophosphate/cardiolipin synthase-like enzyme
MQPGDECWRVERAKRMSVIVDAEAYFRVARRAMLGAKKRILLIGWDFDARIILDHDVDEEPRTVGAFIHRLVERNPELEVFLLRWDLGALKSLGRGTTIFTVLKWMRHPRIHTKLDGHHPTGASHHQKIVIIDDGLAFCGGIDMTGDRWDTRAHLDDDDRRRRPFTWRRYKPWHDAISAVQGPVAAALGTLFRERWRAAGGRDLLPPAEAGTADWPEGLPVDFTDIDVGIARTFPAMPDQQPVHESEAMFLGQIGRAKRHLYIESQYFASRRIAEAIARRLDGADGPEIVVINPVTAQGWLEPLAMDTARARLMETLRRRDRHGRLRMYHPHTTGGTPIYVHAKILIADDRVLRLGSSNMNNRSLRLDTECDVAIEATTGADRACVLAIRDGLIAEHLGLPREEVSAAIADGGSMIAAIERLRGRGKTLRPYEVPDLSTVEAWLADNEVLDPEGPDEMFEPLSSGGLLRRLKRRR